MIAEAAVVENELIHTNQNPKICTEILAWLDADASQGFRLIEKLSLMGASQRAIAKTFVTSQSTVHRILKLMRGIRESLDTENQTVIDNREKS